MNTVKQYFQSRLILGLGLFFSLITFCSVSQAEPVKIRFSHIVAEDTPKGKMAIHFQRLVRQRLGDDKVVVQVFPNTSLYGDNEVVDEMIKGNVEIAAPAISKIKKYSSRFQVLDLPFLFVTPQAANNFLQGPYGDRLLRLVEQHGLLGLGYLNNGMKQLSTNLPAKVPQDINGMRFRIMNSDVLEAQFKQVNAEPMRKPFGKVFELLKTKEIDGQENTWSNIYSKKFYEFQPNIIESNHGYLGYMVLTNKKFWKDLPKEYRTVLDASLKEAIDYGNQIALEKSVQDKNKILETGLSSIHVLSVDERKAWVDAMRPVWQQYEDEIGSELILAAASSR